MSAKPVRLRGARSARPLHDGASLRTVKDLNVRSPDASVDGQSDARDAEPAAVHTTAAPSPPRDEVMERLGLVAAFHDDETSHHSQRIGTAARLISEAMGLGSCFGALLAQAAPLHDIGKVGIRDAILLKPGRLTPEERTAMERHTEIGARILAGGTTEAVRMAELVALSHHERWDGGGYPHRLVGDQTPIGARIVAVVDVFDALTHARPYKEAWPLPEAVAHIVASAGTHFDPAVVAAFRTIDPCDLLGDCDDG